MKLNFIFLFIFSPYILAIPSKMKAKNITKKTEIQTIKNQSFHYQYKSRDKKNPFIPPVIESLTPRMEIPIIHELQNYPLSQLTLVGTWNLKNKKRSCLIVTPDSKSVTAHVGDFLGRKGGQISEIQENFIQINYKKLLKNGKTEEASEFLYIRKKEAPMKKKSKNIIITPLNVKKNSKNKRENQNLTL